MTPRKRSPDPLHFAFLTNRRCMSIFDSSGLRRQTSQNGPIWTPSWKPPAPSPCEARAGRGAPSIELARLIGIPSPTLSPLLWRGGRGNRPAAWWWCQEDAPAQNTAPLSGLTLCLRPPRSGIKVLVQLRLDHLLVTFGTNAVAELGFRVFRDIFVKLLPVVAVVANFFAVETD